VQETGAGDRQRRQAYKGKKHQEGKRENEGQLQGKETLVKWYERQEVLKQPHQR